jgi:hypothetical protein
MGGFGELAASEGAVGWRGAASTSQPPLVIQVFVGTRSIKVGSYTGEEDWMGRNLFQAE